MAESFTKRRQVMGIRTFNDEALSIGTSYADVMNIRAERTGDSVIVIKNMSGSATLSYKIFGSAKSSETALDLTDDSWVNLLPSLDSESVDDKDPSNYSHTRERTVPASGVFYESFSNKWAWVKVQAKSSSGTITGKIYYRGVY